MLTLSFFLFSRHSTPIHPTGCFHFNSLLRCQSVKRSTSHSPWIFFCFQKIFNLYYAWLSKSDFLFLLNIYSKTYKSSHFLNVLNITWQNLGYGIKIMFSFKGMGSRSSMLLIKDNSSYKCHKEEFVRLKLSHKYSTTVTLIPSSGRGIEA